MNRQDFEHFAVQYWGQKVGGRNDLSGSAHFLGTVGHHLINIITHLELRGIDSITDEECMGINKILHDDAYEKYFHIAIINQTKWLLDRMNTALPGFTFTKSWALVDYLRSIGILVPFAQYSVEQNHNLWNQKKD